MRYLGRNMRKVAQAIEQDVNEFTKDVALQIQRAVIEGTPVDVGTARSNWVLRVGSPFSFVYRAFAPGKHLGRGESANMSAAIRQGQGAIGARKTDQPIYITNNLPYIGALNRGHSPQSASGFVQRAISTGTRTAIGRFRFRNMGKVI
jgi:hypothetical protein